MIYKKWVKRWKDTLSAIDKLEGNVEELVVLNKASIEDVKAVEKELGYELPLSFKNVLTEFSSEVDFTWYLPDELEMSEDLEEIFGGHCSWSLEKLLDIDNDRKDWIKQCFSNEKNEYDRVWHNKLAFMQVGNGDFLTLDMSKESEGSVVYLSHDGSESNGLVLGSNFTDFIDKWSRVACVGAEDFQMTPFIITSTSGIESDCNNAHKLRDAIAVDY